MTAREWLPLCTPDAKLTVETAAGVVARVVEALGRPEFAYPDEFEGRGIVTCAGGGRYLPCAWVLVRMLRHLGCSLPIECWHLGPEEVPDHWRELFEPRGVTFVDGRAVAERHPHPRLNGWELKPYAIRFSRFREVLFLDADNVPCVEPSFLFGTPEYARTGLLCWPDYGRLAPDRSAWRVFGDIPYRDEPEHETGQLVVDKARAWPVVLLANWYNVHSAFYYGHNLGDKETWHLAAHRLGYEFAIPARGIHSLRGTMCQHDFSGRRIFQHRNGCKWTLEGNRRVRGFIGEAECLAWLAEAREAVAEGWANMRENDRAIAASVQGVRWLYERVGHDQRPLVLEPEGIVGEGAADCERRWWVWRGEIVVADLAGTVTFRCRPAAAGGWAGRWLEHERMPVRLTASANENSADLRQNLDGSGGGPPAA